MPAMSSQTINTLVLLLLLGVLIYFLQSPCDNEGFEDVKKVPAPKGRVANVNTVNTASEADVKNRIMGNMLEQTEKPVALALLQTQHAMPESPASPRGTPPASPHGTPSAKPNGQDMPDEYDPFDKAGASLEFAFENANGHPSSPDAVDLKNKNQKDYCASDFLPKENNAEWWDDGFSQAKYNLNDDKLINTERYIIGINTVGQSLKNA